MSTLSPPRQAATPAHTATERQELKKTEYPGFDAAPGRRHFMLRRLHSLMGLVFGAYITVHLIVNASGFWPKAYQENVDHIHALEPMLPLIEIVTIFIPLLIHALYGIYITKAGVKFNTTKYNYGGNVRYTMQRWAGIILLLFIGYHIATLHKWGLGAFGVKPFPLFNPHNAAYQSTVGAIRSFYSTQFLNVLVILFYLLGTWAAVFHWANGLWTSAIAWGLTTTAASQKRWGNVCLGFGIVMLVIGSMAWVAFAVVGNPNLPTSETTTLSEETSKAVHAQATGGMQTSSPHEVNEVPAQQH